VWVKDPGMALIMSGEESADEQDRWKRSTEASTSRAQVSILSGWVRVTGMREWLRLAERLGFHDRENDFSV
jgi:hypothetical protein